MNDELINIGGRKVNGDVETFSVGFAKPGPGNRRPGNSRVMKFPGRVIG